jgi:hypothetical protein
MLILHKETLPLIRNAGNEHDMFHWYGIYVHKSLASNTVNNKLKPDKSVTATNNLIKET